MCCLCGVCGRTEQLYQKLFSSFLSVYLLQDLISLSGKRFLCCLLGWNPSILHRHNGPGQSSRTITVTLEAQSRCFPLFKATSHKAAEVLNIFVAKNPKKLSKTCKYTQIQDKMGQFFKAKRYQSTGICIVAPLSLSAPAVSKAHDFRTGNEEENAHAFI